MSSTRGSETWIDLLQRLAADKPDALAFRFLVDGESEVDELTYGELDRRARSLGARLHDLGVQGERALLLYPPGLDFIIAFLGCLHGGVVAVPAYPPDPTRLDRSLPRLRAIAADAQPRVVLTTSLIHGMAEALFDLAPEFKELAWLSTDTLEDASAAWRRPPVDGETLAFLQYTSGSTGTPKGVMLSHRNLLQNSRSIQLTFGDSCAVVGWLPLFHDMGLIGNVLQPLFLGAPSTLLSPIDFLQRPVRWLRAISRYGGTSSGGPNFAYDLCVRKVTPAERETLDLSSWQVAFVGAEPVRAETLERFVQTFRGCGFRRGALFPCYGLAEATLLVTGGRLGSSASIVNVRDDALANGQIGEPTAGGARATTLVSSGRPPEGVNIVVVEADARTPCNDGQVGEIRVSGPGVARGYWNRPEATTETFAAYLSDVGEGPFLRTGDLGFLRGGELFVTGRIKDLLIFRGKNHYPQDIERSVEQSHPAVRPGCTAAFSVQVDGEERLVVATEIHRVRGAAPPGAGELESVVTAIGAAVADAHELAVEAVLLLPPGAIPKTSSGKIQRHACKAGFLASDLEVLLEWRRERSVIDAAADGDSDRLDPKAPVALVRELVRSQVAQVLRVPEGKVEMDAPLTDLNMDSLMVVDLRNRLEVALGIQLEANWASRTPTLAALSELLVDKHLAAVVTRHPTSAAEPSGAPEDREEGLL